MKPFVAAVAAAAVVLAASDAASAATLTVDPADRCYREQQRVFWMAQGFTPNGEVEFSRGPKVLERLRADASGTISGELTLPGLERGRKGLTYVAADQSNPALRAEVTLPTTSTNVSLNPEQGRPGRRLRIRGRGFFGGRVLWAHIVRKGRPASTARRVRIGRVKGACGTVSARRRLFRDRVAPGRYRVQFDTFRRYRKGRRVRFDYVVTIRPPGQTPQREDNGEG